MTVSEHTSAINSILMVLHIAKPILEQHYRHMYLCDGER